MKYFFVIDGKRVEEITSKASMDGYVVDYLLLVMHKGDMRLLMSTTPQVHSVVEMLCGYLNFCGLPAEADELLRLDKNEKSRKDILSCDPVINTCIELLREDGDLYNFRRIILKIKMLSKKKGLILEKRARDVLNTVSVEIIDGTSDLLRDDFHLIPQGATFDSAQEQFSNLKK